jgi:hypothetical protein
VFVGASRRSEGMKAIIVYKDGVKAVDEQNLQKEIKQLQELGQEIVCVLHVSLAIQIRNIEFPKSKEVDKIG